MSIYAGTQVKITYLRISYFINLSVYAGTRSVARELVHGNTRVVKHDVAQVGSARRPPVGKVGVEDLLWNREMGNDANADLFLGDQFLINWITNPPTHFNQPL